LTDLSPAVLAGAAKSNLYALFRQFGRSSVADFHTRPGASWWHTQVAHPWFNGVLAGQDGVGQPALVQEVLAFFKARQVGSFTWWPEPDVPTGAWTSTLQPYGFHRDTNTPGMAANLATLPESVPHPPDLVIEPVTDLATFHEWCRTFAAGYGIPAAWIEPFYELIASLGLGLPFAHYLGLMNQRPVANSTLLLASGVASIHNVATLPEARGQGIGAAMTLTPLQHARQLGYRVGVLQSSAMGYRVYQTLGFQTVCRMEHFYWPATEHADHQEDHPR
jgi:GNAT superfamily N-acetyltransferase